MRLLVTGAAGWISSWLCPELVSRGHEVARVDRDDGDLLDKGAIERMIAWFKPEMVVHLAAQPGRVFGEVDPRVTIASNTTMTAIVARACGEAGVRLCYVSTSEVYGDMGGATLREYDRPGRPVNLYGLSKRWGEEACRLYAPEDLLVIRPSMPYGPRQPVGVGRAALPTFIWRAMRGEEIEVHRGAERSWCYATDLARGMADVIEYGSGIYNVGRDDDRRSMLDLAHRIRKEFGLRSCTVRVVEPTKIVSPIKRLSSARLRSLGWSPQVSLDEGMIATYEWLKEISSDDKSVVEEVIGK